MSSYGSDKSSNSKESEYFGDFDYLDTGNGKSQVKVLRVKRNGPSHDIKEYLVSTELTLDSTREYTCGGNSDIVPTDSQKNIVYVMAKTHGLKSPEHFGVLLCSHFLNKYSHVKKANISIEEHPWQRIVTDDGSPHNHAFISTPTAIRFSCVTCERGELPNVESGLKGLRVIKTTQSAFEHFIRDEFATLPESPDRIFSTIIYCKWRYGVTTGLDYDHAWNTVQSSVLQSFAGSPVTGIFSPSVQHTLYLVQKKVLEKVPQMSWIEVQLPNKHYTPVDFSQFKRCSFIQRSSDNDIFLPSDHPAGNMRAVLGRKSRLSTVTPLKAKL